MSFGGAFPAKLLRLDEPLSLTTIFVRRDGLVLALLHYADSGTAPHRSRVMNEPGLTHMSFTVADIPATLAKVIEFNGEVLKDTDLGAAIFVKDPDGQLIELVAS